mgnify:FL=1
MLERYLVEHCSPTLASIKTANLFTFAYQSSEELNTYVKEWNQKFRSKGISIAILRNRSQKALLYVYRKEKLNADLRKPGVTEFLAEHGYEEFHADYGIEQLKKKFSEDESFPHEIGLFLGYPLEDVIGFIENAGKNSKCSGCWKVYCNECETLKLFAQFKKCKDVYLRLFLQGKRSVLQLTVA